MRPGEATNLQWPDVYLQPAVRAKVGYIRIREGKSKNAAKSQLDRQGGGHAQRAEGRHQINPVGVPR